MKIMRTTASKLLVMGTCVVAIGWVSWAANAPAKQASAAATAVSRIGVPWPSSFLPDTVATMRTKRGEMIKWESMGPISRDRPENGKQNQKFARYPRYFKCTLSQPSHASGRFDLYDIGVQRNLLDSVEISINAAGVVVTNEETGQVIQPVSGIYTIHPADYNRNPDSANGDRPRRPISLRFTGATCVVNLFRLAQSPDSDEGSPPPPDPGNGNSELP